MALRQRNSGYDQQMLDQLAARRWVLFVVLSSAICLSYFYLLDRLLISSRGFAHIFALLITIYDVNTAWLAVFICVAASFWRHTGPVLKLVDGIGAHPNWIAGCLVVAASVGALVVYHNYPLCMDEYSAVFQSKIFASGHLYAQLPPSLVDWLVTPGFNGLFLVASHSNGHAIEIYWPGYSALLAPFQWLNVPWLCNASVSGLALFLIHRITQDVTGEPRAAGWAVLFALSSGAFVAYSISYYSMQAHLACNLLFASLLWKPTLSRSLAAGLVGSLAIVLHNPFPHALFAAPWMLALLLDRHDRRYLVPLAIAYLPGIAVMLGWMSLRAGIMPIGPSLPSPFGWPNELLLNMRLAGVVKLCIWATPGLLLFACIGWKEFRGHRQIRLLTASAVMTFIGYLFVKLDQGHGWGYRYFQSAWGVLPILGACALSSRSRLAPLLTPFAGAAAILSLFLIVPLQLAQIDEFITDHLALIPASKRPGNNVYFVAQNGGAYIADAIQIDPWLRDQDLLLASRGAVLDEELVRQNWPEAVKLGQQSFVQQWYLGPREHRVSGGASGPDEHFDVHFAETNPDAKAIE